MSKNRETREIKFRGKSIHTGEWLYGCLLKTMGHREGTFKYWISHEVLDDEQIFEATIGQFINVFADEFEPIYEGDLVKKGDFIGVVTYEPQGACWIAKSEDNKYLELKESAGYGDERGVALDSWKIVGNIHDNKPIEK